MTTLTVQNQTCPRHTPWGPVQQQDKKAPGIWSISTAGHGGFYVAPEVFATIPECLTRNLFAGDCWFEEDCDWAYVCLAFPDLFTPYERYCAVRSAMGSSSNFAKWSDFVMTDAGKKLWVEYDTFKTVNAEKFQMGGSGSGSQPDRWFNSADSIDGKTRLKWEELSEGWRDRPTLPMPFTRADIESRIIPGTLRVELRA